MNHLPIIIEREYFSKVKNKSFIIMTFVTPIIFIALISFVAYLVQLNSDRISVISVLDESGKMSEAFIDSNKIKYKLLDIMPLEEAKKISQKEESFGLLHIENWEDFNNISNFVLYTEESSTISIIGKLESQIDKVLTDLNLIGKGIDLEIIKESKMDIEISQESFKGEKTSKTENIIKLIFGVLVGCLLFFFIVMYGNLIMRSVIEEKTSRIIEIIISSAKPIQLMLGKIIGSSLAGITQFTIWIVLGWTLLSVISLILGIDLSEVQTPQKAMIEQSLTSSELNMKLENIMISLNNIPILNLIISFIFFFIGGFLLFGSLFAAVGSAVDSETDTQQFMWPIMIPLVLSFYVGIFTVIEDPNGIVSTIFSFIPFTSPVVMMMRISFGVPIWQQIISFIILVSTIFLIIWLAAKIYRVGILMYGKKPSFKELLKWMRY